MREPKRYARETKCYYYCKSFKCHIAYFDNRKEDQPRYRCDNPSCRAFFTFRSKSKRPKGKKYGKKGEDPAEVHDLYSQCSSCQEPRETRFKYYKKKDGSNSQPRFMCLRCTSKKTLTIKRPKITEGSVNSEMPENDMADSMEVGYGNLMDFDIFDGALAQMVFIDTAPVSGLPNEDIFDDQIELPDFTLSMIDERRGDQGSVEEFATASPSMFPGSVLYGENPTTFYAAKETSFYRPSDLEAALMVDDIEEIITSEDYRKFVEYPDITAQGSLKVAEANEPFASELEDLLKQAEIAVTREENYSQHTQNPIHPFNSDTQKSRYI